LIKNTDISLDLSVFLFYLWATTKIMDKLSELGIKYGTDKIGSHTYTPIYNKYFQFIRLNPLRILEIGYGGYGDPDKGGESARMWAEYFPVSDIIVTDINPKNVTDVGYSFRCGDQTDDSFMLSLGWFDIIIDDGSHQSEHMIHTFETLWKHLNDGGVYVMEDTQGSYWPELSPKRKVTDYFKALTDGLNYNEVRRSGYQPTEFDQTIVSIHFYHNLIFIFKGDNTEPSNTVKNV